MKLKPVVAAIVVMLMTAGMSGLTFAGTCNSHTCTAKIDRLYVRANGTILVGTDADETTLTNCTPDSGLYFRLNMSDSNADTIYRTLLGAFFAQRTVSIRAKDSVSTCEVHYVLLDDEGP